MAKKGKKNTENITAKPDTSGAAVKPSGIQWNNISIDWLLNYFRSLTILHIVLLAIISFVALVIVYWVLDKIFIYYAARSYVEEIADAFDGNKYLANVFVYLTFIAIAFFSGLILSFSKIRRRAGILGIVALLVTHSLLMWWGTRTAVVDIYGKPLKYYVITRDGVRYNERPGIDPATGRMSSPVKPELVELLNAYAKGQRPVRITNQNVQFFNTGTGESIIWYHKNNSGLIDVFDLMGFDPETGEELTPVTKDIAEDWKRQFIKYGTLPKRIEGTPIFFDPRTGQPIVWYFKNRYGRIELFDRQGFHPETGDELKLVNAETVEIWKAQNIKPTDSGTGASPKLIDPLAYSMFNSVTGQAQVWYWHGGKGIWEFYDNSGYHPRTGDPLLLINKDAIDLWRSERVVNSGGTQSPPRPVGENPATACDNLAANPNDRQRAQGIQGAEYEILQTQLDAAVAACSNAVRQYPTELRFQYQLARAQQKSNPQAAAEIYQNLVRLRYAAAYDNYGWLQYIYFKNPSEGVKYFRQGVQLNDPDSFVSLAEMIDRGVTFPMDAGESKLELYRRAAQLGHTTAQRAYEVELAKQGGDEIDANIYNKKIGKAIGKVLLCRLTGAC
jgi:hypothetical protein